MGLVKRNKMTIEISNGELFDKLTILEIKMEKINKGSLLKEWENLNDKAMTILSIFSESVLHRKIDALEDVNRKLWDIEDWIRVCEKEQRFDKEFVELARSVYKLNDQRYKLKKDIDIITKSNLSEEKLYSK